MEYDYVFCLQLLIFFVDSGPVPDLARLMIRDCRYDVSATYFSQPFILTKFMITLNEL